MTAAPDGTMLATRGPAVVGLDVALRATGVAYPDGTWTTLKPAYGAAQHSRRLYHLARLIDGVLRLQRPDLAVLEGYSLGGPRTVAAARLAEVGGIARLALVAHRIPMVEIPPGLLKKMATGHGNADKTAMVAAARRRLGYDGDSHDEADALFLRHAAHLWYVDHDDPDRHLLEQLPWPQLP